LGQIIATLDVVVPDEYRLVMNTLTRECKVSSYDDVKKTIEEDLGYPTDIVFKQLDIQPISSASIAQVHRGVLLNGEKVAVKVQHR
jgi:predicted unusual protein kinase regulating ubiquinone biosynthesis (AarF/ABC1/UbiB family)